MRPLCQIASHEFCLFSLLATIVIHCASGKRAMTAKSILEEKGYTNVLNAGGYVDLKAMLDD